MPVTPQAPQPDPEVPQEPEPDMPAPEVNPEPEPFGNPELPVEIPPVTHPEI